MLTLLSKIGGGEVEVRGEGRVAASSEWMVNRDGSELLGVATLAFVVVSAAA